MGFNMKNLCRKVQQMMLGLLLLAVPARGADHRFNGLRRLGFCTFYNNCRVAGVRHGALLRRTAARSQNGSVQVCGFRRERCGPGFFAYGGTPDKCGRDVARNPVLPDKEIVVGAHVDSWSTIGSQHPELMTMLPGPPQCLRSHVSSSLPGIGTRRRFASSVLRLRRRG